MNRWIDAHCHLGDDADAHVAAATAAGVVGIVDVACRQEDWATVRERAERHPNVWAALGVHPHEAEGGIGSLAENLVLPNVVAVGECGLDYFYDHADRAAQRNVFAQHIALAFTHDLPLMIHTRDAWDDTFAVLDSEGVPPRTVLHCFTGGPAEAAACLERSTMLSIAGIATFKNATDLQEAVKLAPLDRLMVETDAPYLAPVPYRGKTNQPAWVVHVGEKVAELKGLPSDVVAAATTANAQKFFGVNLVNPN